MLKIFVITIALTLYSSSEVDAQNVVNCNGRWTNQPCDGGGGVPANTPTKASVLSPDEARARSLKETLLHNLTMKNLEAKRKFDTDIDLTYSRDLCFNQGKSLEQCRDELEKMEAKLDRKINLAAALKREEEKKKTPETVKETTTQQTTIIVRDNYPYYRGRPRVVPTYRPAPIISEPRRSASGAPLTPPVSATASPWR